MSVHYRIEVLYEALDGPACGYQQRGRLSEDAAEVDCPECIAACGFAPVTQDTDPQTGNPRIAA